MKVFLDVGAHVGETLRPVLDPRHDFTKIVCFEPVESCCEALERLADRRVEVCRFGLSRENLPLRIFGAGSLGASFWSETHDLRHSEVVEVRRAADWFREHLADDDEVYLKLNCEGSECDILDDLLASGEIRKVRSALVDFDVRKVPSLAYRERETRDRFREAGFSRILCLKESYTGPTHTATVENWLRAAGANPAPPSAWWRWRFIWFPASTRRAILISKGAAHRLLPESLYERMRRRLQKSVFRYPPDAG